MFLASQKNNVSARRISTGSVDASRFYSPHAKLNMQLDAGFVR